MDFSTKTKELMKEYDGFFFYPQYDEDIHVDYKIEAFVFNEKKLKSKKIEFTEIGDKYYIAFFKSDKETILKFDEDFEAIFVDPLIYVKNLIGSNLYGCMVRKTSKSGKWFKGFLTDFKNRAKIVTVDKLNEGNKNA